MNNTEEKFSNLMIKNVPKHVAIICDGNGRWGIKNGLTRSMGHKAGCEPIEDVIKACDESGVKVLTLYVFSTENWSRSENEIDFLIDLFTEFFKQLRSKDIGNIKVRHIGITDNIPYKLIDEIRKTELSTQKNTGMILNIALNYSGRSEITCAIKNIMEFIREENLDIEDINENVIEKFLFTSGEPNVDLIIRTSGEARISNFLLWKSAKAKIWITEKLWPDFKKEDLWEAFRFYSYKE